MTTRDDLLTRDAIDGLAEYYPCLNDGTLAAEFAEAVRSPNTGSDQERYENIRDQIEAMAKKYPWAG